MNELIKLGHLYNLNINELLVLYSIKYPQVLVDQPVSMDLLNKLGYIQDENAGLTELGYEVMDKVDALFKKSKVKPLPISLKPGNNRITEYIDLWPKIVLPSGKPARSSQKLLLKCFTWFFSEYHYSWDTILEATESYLSEQASNQYKFCRTSQYFVVKTSSGMKESTLADYCEIVENGSDDKTPKYSIPVV